MSNIEQLPAIAKAWRELALEGSRFVRSRVEEAEATDEQTAEDQSKAHKTNAVNSDERR